MHDLRRERAQMKVQYEQKRLREKLRMQEAYFARYVCGSVDVEGRLKQFPEGTNPNLTVPAGTVGKVTWVGADGDASSVDGILRRARVETDDLIFYLREDQIVRRDDWQPE